MLGNRACKGTTDKGLRCLASPIGDSEYCLFHDPEHAEAVRDGRRLGGMRRKREGTLQAAYDLGNLATVEGLQRILEIAVMDAIGLDNSIPRMRALIAAVLAGAKLLEIGEQEERLAAVEAALGPRLVHRGKSR